MNPGIEMTFLAVPTPPDPYEDEFVMECRCAAVTYRRRHPECWPKTRAEEMAELVAAAHGCIARRAAWVSTPYMTDKQITNFIANRK